MKLQKEIGFNHIKALGAEHLLNVNLVEQVITSKNKDNLRELIFLLVGDLNKLDIELENYYYGKYVCMSDEEFDMFTLDTITEIFELFGYKCDSNISGGIEDWKLSNNGYLAGELTITKDNKKFITNIYHSMHNKLISMFVDTKEFKVA